MTRTFEPNTLNASVDEGLDDHEQVHITIDRVGRTVLTPVVMAARDALRSIGTEYDHDPVDGSLERGERHQLHGHLVLMAA
jgi:hypothetical protein